MDEILLRLEINPKNNIYDIKEELEEMQLDILSKLDVIQAKINKSYSDIQLEKQLMKDIEDIEESLHLVNWTLKRVSVGLSLTKSDQVIDNKDGASVSKELGYSTIDLKNEKDADEETYEYTDEDTDDDTDEDLNLIFHKAVKLIDNPERESDYKKAFNLFHKIIKFGGISGKAGIGRMYLKGLGVKEDKKKAYTLIKEAAELGDPYGQCLMGELYEDGIVVDRDLANASVWYWKSSMQECARGQTQLGKLYIKGHGVPKDRAYAMPLIESAAKKEYAEAEYILASFYKKENDDLDTNVSLELYKKSAMHGFSEAQATIGEVYLNNAKSTSEIEEAKLWILKAAKKNNAKADYLLGHMYDNGLGMGKDEEKAIQLYEQSARGGFADAQYAFAEAYYHGRVVDKNWKESVKWYQKAAYQEHAKAQYELGRMYSYGYGVEKDDVQCFNWIVQAGKNGHAKAKNDVAAAYIDGVVVEQDYNVAYKIFEKAALEGCVEAINNLGVCKREGIGTKVDINESIRYFKKAISKGYINGYSGLAVIYSSDKYGKEDLIEAYRCFKLAGDEHKNSLINFIRNHSYRDNVNSYKLIKWIAENSEPSYYTSLGDMNRNGLGTRVNYREAYRCYKLAGESGCTDMNFLFLSLSNEDKVENFRIMKEIVNDEDPLAYKCLGDMYFEGLGTTKDYKEAYRCYKLAGATYRKNLERLILTLSKEDEVESFVLLKRLAEGKDPFINKCLGDMYFNGLGTVRDYKEANQCYKKAYEGKLQDVNFVELFRRVEDAIIMEMTYQESLKMLETSSFQKGIDTLIKLSEQKCADAQIAIGKLYMNGYRLPKNLRLAMSYFKMAKTLNHAEANKYINELELLLKSQKG